jgi:sugar phosphate permease
MAPLPSTASGSALEKSAYNKVAWRLIPFLFLCYVVAYLDRVNVGFAKLQMLTDLKFSETIYGLGAGIFFVGYFLFEVPSNIILHRTGARVWIARIMVTWGVPS